MTCKKNLKATVVAISLVAVPSTAMELNLSSESPIKTRRESAPPVRTSSGQNSPRSLALSSPRNSGILALNRSGSNSDLAIAVVAQSTLKRMVTPEKLASLKKRSNSVGSLTSPRGASGELQGAKPTGEEKLAELGKSLQRSKSPLEEREAEPVFGAQNVDDLLAQIAALKIPRGSMTEDGTKTPRNSVVDVSAFDSEKEGFENLFGELS